MQEKLAKYIKNVRSLRSDIGQGEYIYDQKRYKLIKNKKKLEILKVTSLAKEGDKKDVMKFKKMSEKVQKSVSEKWQLLKNVIQTTAEEILVKKKTKIRDRWHNELCRKEK